MASTIIHMAITRELAKDAGFRDVKRLMLGSILPDACLDGRNAGHMRIQVGGGGRTLNLEGFRARFGDLMLSDELYLGYYLHLVEDVLHRRFMYTDHGMDSRAPGYVEQLHRDYAVTNAHVIEKYGLREDMVEGVELAGERLSELGNFDVPGLLERLHGYFAETPEADAVIFTAEMADELILRGVELGRSEIAAVRAGGECMSGVAWAWGVIRRGGERGFN